MPGMLANREHHMQVEPDIQGESHPNDVQSEISTRARQQRMATKVGHLGHRSLVRSIGCWQGALRALAMGTMLFDLSFEHQPNFWARCSSFEKLHQCPLDTWYWSTHEVVSLQLPHCSNVSTPTLLAQIRTKLSFVPIMGIRWCYSYCSSCCH